MPRAKIFLPQVNYCMKEDESALLFYPLIIVMVGGYHTKYCRVVVRSLPHRAEDIDEAKEETGHPPLRADEAPARAHSRTAHGRYAHGRSAHGRTAHGHSGRQHDSSRLLAVQLGFKT